MSAAFNKFNQFVQDTHHGVHKFNTDTIKVMLTNTAPVAANAVKADIAEIAAGNGYPAGGAAATLVSSGQTAGVYKLVLNDVSFLASGGSLPTFRYAVVYNDTPTSPLKPLIGWFDYGSPGLTLTNGNSFLVDLDQVNGLLQDT